MILYFVPTVNPSSTILLAPPTSVTSSVPTVSGVVLFVAHAVAPASSSKSLNDVLPAPLPHAVSFSAECVNSYVAFPAANVIGTRIVFHCFVPAASPAVAPPMIYAGLTDTGKSGSPVVHPVKTSAAIAAAISAAIVIFFIIFLPIRDPTRDLCELPFRRHSPFGRPYCDTTCSCRYCIDRPSVRR